MAEDTWVCECCGEPNLIGDSYCGNVDCGEYKSEEEIAEIQRSHIGEGIK